MNKIAVIGLVGESVFLAVERFHRGGETVEAESMHTQPGGKGFNQAVAAKRAGAAVSFLAAVGGDAYALQIRRFLDAEKIAYSLAEKKDKTAYAAILTDRQGSNRVTEYTGARLEREDVAAFEGEIAAADILLLSNEVPPEVNECAAELAYKHGVRVILNPAPARPLSASLKEKICLFTPNEFETQGLEDCKNVIVTLGEKGCLIRETGENIPAVKAKAVDTTGAGDVFNGYLAAALASGKSLREAAAFANVASGIAVTRKGAVTSVPLYKEVMNLYGSQSERT